MSKLLGDLSLFVLLLSLLFIPVGSFGLAEVTQTEEDVLSTMRVRTERLEEPGESSESTETGSEVDVEDEEHLAPDQVIPFYR